MAVIDREVVNWAYPFSAIAGQDALKLALMPVAVNPAIGGVQARADRGVLYEVNPLDGHAVDVPLDSAAMGGDTIEREGIRFFHAARFTLIGTMNPEEGELRPQLLDRFGPCVHVAGLHTSQERVEAAKPAPRSRRTPRASPSAGRRRPRACAMRSRRRVWRWCNGCGGVPFEDVLGPHAA